jgi:hypothetical protein
VPPLFLKVTARENCASGILSESRDKFLQPQFSEMRAVPFWERIKSSSTAQPMIALPATQRSAS